MFKNLLDDFDEKSAPEINLLEGYEEEPETGKSALGALGKTISRVPENLLAAGITAIQGVKGASVTDQGIGDKIVNWVDERNKALSREYEGTGDVIPGLISKQDIAELGPNLAFSGVSMGATVAGGAAGAATPIPGGAIAGGLAGGGIAAHRMQSYQAMNSWLKKQNKESIEKFGRPISPEEEAVFKEKFSALASESGLWEAGPEAIGNVLELALITAKKKIPGVNLVPDTVMKKIASGALRVGGLLATELGTESVTQMGQQRVGVEAGEAPEGEVKREWTSGDDWLKSAREVLPQVLLLTGVMGAGGAAYRRATSANDQLSKDIDAQMGELAEESQAVNEGVPGTGIDIAESAKELGGKSGGELGKEEAGARKEERREGSPFKPAKPFVPGMDRRKDPETRKRVADMSPEERSQALLTDTLTGLSNKRAYEERERLSVQSSIDVDGLKYVNDTFGHEAGNQLLKKVGDAIRQAAGENPSYHFHGDEFVLEGNSPEEISDIVSRARDILAKEPLSFEKDGKKTSYTAGFSYGTAGTLDAADQEMLKDKAQRKIIRGELPPGTDNQKFDPEGNILRTYTKSKFPEADALFDLFPETAKAQIVPPSLFRGILVNRYVSPLMESETPQFRIQQLEELEALNKDLDIGNLRHDSIASIDAAINMRKIDEKMGQVLKEVASLVKSPDFHIAIKDDVTYEGAYNVFDNVIELKSPVAFAHEIGHWGFFNILSGKDRIEFMEKMVEKFGRGEKEKLAPQLAIPPTARSESGGMFQSNGADNFAEYFAEQFRQYLHSNRLTDTQHETLFKKVLGFLKTIYQRLRDKNIIDVDVVPFIEKILNPVIDIGAEKTTSQSAEEPTISELEAELDRWKKYTKDIPKSLSFKELGRRSDEVQKLIDDRHDKLDAEGIEWEKQQKDPELSELYAKRIAYDTVAAQKGYDGAKQIVEDNLRGIPKDSTYASVDSILREHYGLVDAPQTGVFMMAKYTGEALENPATIKQVGHNITQLIAERDYPNVDFWTLFESSNSVLTQKGKERYVQEGIAIAKKINIELRKFFTEESGNVLLPSKIEERAPVWYSQMTKFLTEKLPGKGTPVEMETLINNFAKKGEFKAEELEWSGVISELLKKQKGKVSKQQVLDYLEENNVQVKEVVKDSELPTEWTVRRRREDGLFVVRDEDGAVYGEGETPAKAKADALITVNEEGRTVTPAKFSQYQVPGGENYKELFLTADSRFGAWNDGHSEYSDIENPVVRIRFNERYDGKKKHLFMEELQPPKKEEQEKQPEFMQKPQYWAGLAMRQMVRYAAENGFDSISWTTGEVQADRYDLSKQVDRIGWDKSRGDNVLLDLTLKNGNIENTTIPINSLSDFVGKEIADKILASKDEYGEFSGLDLKVGGEGLKTLYDVTFVNIANKFFNKNAWGNAKVGTAEIETENGETITVHSLKITSEMKNKALSEGMPLFSKIEETPKSEIGELTDALAGVKKRKETFSPGVDLAGIGDRSIKKSISTFEKVKEISKGVWDTWQKFQTAKEPEWTQYDNIMGEYEAETVKADHEGYKFAKQILALVPRRYQEAMTNYIEAGGDSKTLLTRAGKTKDGKLAEGYRTAANLPPDIKVYAEEVRGFFDSWLTRLQEADVLGDSFIRDYVNHVWGEDSKIGKEINAQADMGMFKTNPALARKRIIESYFEGEQLGLVPRDKGIGFLVATYAKAASEAINARTAVKQLFKGKAKDGLAILVPDKATAKPISKTEYTVVNPKLESGRAQRVFETEQEAANYIAKAKNKDLQLVPREKKILLVKQKFGNPITEDGRAYRPAPSHQALKKITWVGTDTAGNPVLYEGSALVHPDHYDNFSKAMGTSQIKKSPFGMTILRGTSFAKQTLLSASFFHPVQLAVHAIGHNVNILKMKAVNLNDPVQLNAVKHGLRMEFGHGLQQFNEGLWGGGLVEKIPIIGDFSRKLGEYTFKDLLPRFKMNMYEEALKRNTKRYGKTLTADQIMSKTADEANAAFGELNYRKLGRSKTMQDVLRLLTLAPDFLEARVRFTAQAFTKGHLEQMAAIGRLSAEIFILSRIINMLANDGDPKWEKPFGFVIGKHESTLRSVPGDILHAIKDPRNFIYHRLNPTLTRTTIEYLTGRDQFGKERDVTGQIRDFFVTHIPIPIQGPFRPGRDAEWWESAISSMGLSTYKDKSEAEKLMSKLISKNVPAKQLEKEESDLINAKAKLKDAIRNKGTIDPEVRKELAKLSPEQLRRVVRDANKYTQFGEKVNSGRLDLIDTLQVYKRTLYPWSDPKERMLSANALAKKYINAARNTPYKIASLSKGEREDIRRALSKEGMESDILGAIGSWY